jgi:hypothetical protein
MLHSLFTPMHDVGRGKRHTVTFAEDSVTLLPRLTIWTIGVRVAYTCNNENHVLRIVPYIAFMALLQLIKLIE